MPAYVWSLVGLLLDVGGVLLLSVEAIKLENLRNLRERLLIPLHEWSKPAQVKVVGPGDPDYDQASTGNADFAWWLFTHAGSGALTLSLIGLGLRAELPSAPAAVVGIWVTLHLIAKVVIVGVSLLITPLVLITVGEGWHYLIIWITGRFIALANFVDQRTPDGTIGIIGVTLAMLGFLLQFVGTWMGRPT
jgi:hypothetical protein